MVSLRGPLFESPSRPHYLVVEDDSVLAATLCRFLQSAGGTATAASRVSQALEIFGGGALFAGLVLDVGLPDGSGLELLASLRARGVRTPALVLTGHRDEETIAGAQLQGAQFLPKPPREENLRAFVATTLDLHRVARGRLELAVRDWSERHALTKREGEVLFLAATGDARGELAAKLGVQETTMKTTVRRLLRKSGQFTLGDLTAKIHRALFVDE